MNIVLAVYQILAKMLYNLLSVRISLKRQN